MKTLLVLLLWTNGLVGTLSAASIEETNGKLKLGDPIPAVTSRIKTGNQSLSLKSQKPVTRWCIFIRKR